MACRRRAVAALFLVIFLGALLPAGLAAATEVASAPLSRAANARNGMVRVYLSSLGNPTSLDLTVSGSYTANGATDVTLQSGDRVGISFNKNTGRITMTRGGVSYDMGTELNLRRHQTSGESGLRIAQARQSGNLYPGDLQLKAQLSGGSYRLYPIVHVYIESYLKGVVPYEMGNSAHVEALKAQAVAARTYTLNKMNTRASSLYDVVDTTNDQVYYGNSDSTTRCSQAVEATKGIVLMNGSSLTGTYYTASNGGQTESARNLWGSSGYDYLGVKNDPFDEMNAASVVRKTVVYGDNTFSGQKSAIKDLLHAKASAAVGSSNVTVTTINAITPHTPKYGSPSRLYTKLDFAVTAATPSGSRSLTLTCDIFSELEGPLGMSINASQNELWSVEKNGANFTLKARRYGHGIGMSQRGAMQMGSLGYTYDQILGFYYEDCRRVQYTFTHTILASIENGGSLITTEENPADITPSAGATATVKLVGLKDRLAVRSAASDTGSILTSVINGGLVNVLAKGDSWTMIRLGSIVGYVPTSALKFNGEAPSASEATPTQISQWATVNCTGTLNLRSEGSIGSTVITTIPSGAILCVFRVQGSWAQVQYGASTGWASTDFLQMSAAYPGEVTGQISGGAVVRIPSGSGTVNLRATASTSGQVLATLSHGTQVTVNSSDGSWCSVVAADGTRGYIMADFLVFDGSAPPTQPPSTPGTPAPPALGFGEVEAVVYTASTALNLRAEPSTQAAVLAALPRGESVVVTHRGEEWSAVRYGSLTGYVSTRYLRFPSDESTAPSTPSATARVTTQSGSLNLRKQPSLGSTVLTQIPRGAQVSVLENLTTWCRVSYGGQTGYVMTTYLTMEGGSTTQPTGNTATVTTPSGTLNLRETASADARILTTIKPGAQVTVLQRGTDWCHITYGSRTGYVMTKFLTFGSEGGSTPSVPVPPEVSDSATVHTGNGGLNLRETASSAARILTVIPDGASVTRLQAGAEWTQIRYAAYTGYVMTRYLQDGSSAAPSAPSVQEVAVTTDGDGLNLRSGPTTASEVIIGIPNGAKVTLLEKGDPWSRVRYSGLEGYVMTGYLSIGQGQPPAESGGTAQAQTAWIREDVTGGVNMRYMPDTSGQVLAVLAPGTEIIVTLSGAEWSAIKFGAQAGYVMSRYITSTPPSSMQPADTQPPAASLMYVSAASGLNLRQEASTGAVILTSLPHGAAVDVLSNQGDEWCLVRYGQWQGYVARAYLSAAKPAALPAAVPEPSADAQPVYDPTLYDLTGWEAVIAPQEGSVNVRAWCDNAAPVRLSIPKGETVRLLQFGDTWCKILYGEAEGYCMTQYLTLREAV